MVKQLKTETHQEIVYPDSDGQPMADNTIQFRWIAVLYHNLAWLFAENPEVFVAGDLLWYPELGIISCVKLQMSWWRLEYLKEIEVLISNGKKIILLPK